MSTERQNALIVMATQAMLGAFSRNVRMIELRIGERDHFLTFHLEHDSEVDREDAEDIADDMSILTERDHVDHEVIVSNGALPPASSGSILLYREKSETHVPSEGGPFDAPPRIPTR